MSPFDDSRQARNTEASQTVRPGLAETVILLEFLRDRLDLPDLKESQIGTLKERG
jgi:hypothetical protein